MLQRSPILRFALEVLQHALESYCSEKARDKKIAVLHLAQTVELSIKAALVELNISIYEKQGNRTITPHEALASLSRAWSIDRVDGYSRIELLIDERNAIQHRYGTIDEVTLDYHMQTAFDILNDIMRREFDIDLADWIKDNIEKKVWERIRFVTGEDPKQTPSEAIVGDRSPVLDFVDGFSRYERGLREAISALRGGENFYGSTLDVMIKVLSNTNTPNKATIKKLPEVYKLRNRLVHGDQNQVSIDEVRLSLSTLDNALQIIHGASSEMILRAISASERGLKGTTLDDNTIPSEMT